MNNPEKKKYKYTVELFGRKLEFNEPLSYDDAVQVIEDLGVDYMFAPMFVGALMNPDFDINKLFVRKPMEEV